MLSRRIPEDHELEMKAEFAKYMKLKLRLRPMVNFRMEMKARVEAAEVKCNLSGGPKLYSWNALLCDPRVQAINEK